MSMRIEKPAILALQKLSGHGTRVLVVDCDPMCLLTISKILRTLGFEVLTVERAAEALALTLERENKIDVVLAELHMPEMDGLQLLEEIGNTSKLPVAIMSIDNDEKAMLNSLQRGAFFYMVKPVLVQDIMELWEQFLSKRKGKRQVRKIEKKAVDERKDDEGNTPALTSPKRPKLTWTPELHNRFLFAVGELGLANAQPKRILEHMGEEGITKVQVSRHLQKYRLSLRQERQEVQPGLELASTRTTLTDQIGSSFAPHNRQFQAPEMESVRTAPRPGVAGHPQSYAAFQTMNRQHPTILSNQNSISLGMTDSATTAAGQNQIDMVVNPVVNIGSGNTSIGSGWFSNSVQNQLMPPAQPWLPPSPPSKQEAPNALEIKTEFDEWFDKKEGGKQF